MENYLSKLSALCGNHIFTDADIEKFASNDSMFIEIIDLYKILSGKRWRYALIDPSHLSIGYTAFSKGKVEALMKMNWVQSLTCNNWEGLIDFPSIPSLKKLNIHSNMTLRSIESMPNLKELYCNLCSRLTIIKAMPNLLNLSCQNCEALKTIESMPNLVHLSCDACFRLIEIEVMPSLEKLSCDFCYDLEEIESMSNLNELYCNGCSGLTRIKAMPNLKVLSCESTFRLDIEDFGVLFPNCKFYF